MKRDDAIWDLRQILLRRRESLRRSLDDELSLLGIHEDDEDASDERLFSRLSETESHELSAIDDALERLCDGRYGTCEDCGGHIPLARLRAVPYAALCIQCQRRAERHRQAGGHQRSQISADAAERS